MTGDALRGTIEKVRMRLRLWRAFRLGLIALGGASGLFALALGLGAMLGAREFFLRAAIGAIVALPLAAGAGFILGWLKSLNRGKAALWLDRAQNDEGLFTAALDCAGRWGSLKQGPFDEAIIAKAESALEAAPLPSPPRRALLWPGLLATGPCMTLIILVLFARPLPAPSGPALPGSVPRSQFKARSLGDGAKDSAAGLREQMDPKEMADLLYSNEPEMARLLEEAIRSGRLDDARRLAERAEQAATDLAERKESSGGSSEGQREKAKEALRKLEEGQAQSGEEQQEEGKAGGSGDEKDESGYKGPAAQSEAQKPSDKASGTGGKPTEGKAGSGGAGSLEESGDSSGKGGSDGEPGAAAKGKSGKAGTGSGSEKDWGTIKPLETTWDLTLAAKDGESLFELLVPEKERGRAATQRLKDALAAAERAMARDALPEEYRASVRSYFMKLIEAANR